MRQHSMKLGTLVMALVAVLIVVKLYSDNDLVIAHEVSTEVGFPKVSITINDTCEENGCAEGINLAGTTYVPLRVVLETMGATVEWNELSRSVNIQNKQKVSNELKTDHLSNTSLNSGISQQEPSIHSDTEQLNEKIGIIINKLYKFDQQMQLAKEFYVELGDITHIKSLEGLRYERIEEYQNLFKMFLNYEKQYKEHPDITGEVLKKINEVKAVLDQQQLSVQSLQQYINNENKENMRLYLNTRKHAYDKLEDLEESLHGK